MAKTADEIYDRICDMLSYSRTKLLMGEPNTAKEIWVSALNQWYQNRLVLATNTTSYNALIHQFDVTEEGFKSKGVDVTGIQEELEPSYGQNDTAALMAENERLRALIDRVRSDGILLQQGKEFSIQIPYGLWKECEEVGT